MGLANCPVANASCACCRVSRMRPGGSGAGAAAWVVRARETARDDGAATSAKTAPLTSSAGTSKSITRTRLPVPLAPAVRAMTSRPSRIQAASSPMWPAPARPGQEVPAALGDPEGLEARVALVAELRPNSNLGEAIRPLAAVLRHRPTAAGKCRW